jgi:hypothetical protein
MKFISEQGYKRNSPDKNNPFNIIPSGNITMKDVDHPVLGIDNLGNQQLMQPGLDYEYPGDAVFEIPIRQFGGDMKFWRPVLQQGGQNIIYVDKDDPRGIERYNAYQDSTSAYNKSINLRNQAMLDIRKNLNEINSRRNMLTSLLGANPVTAVRTKSKDTWSSYPGGIKPVTSYSYFTSKDNLGDQWMLGGYDVLKKPEQQVVINNQKPQPDPIIARQKQNTLFELTSQGLIQRNADFNPNLEVRPQARIPKYFNVTDKVNQPFGGTETQYRSYPDQTLPSISTQKYPDGTPMNIRTMVPVYQEGGQNDFMNVKNWYNSYIQSPLYKRNIENSGYSNVDDVINQRQANVNRAKYVVDENKAGSYYTNRTNKVHHSPVNDNKIWSTYYTSDLPEDEVLAHELGHAVLDSSDSILLGSNALHMNQYDYNQLESRQKNKKISRGVNENYADQKALQYMGAKLGIYKPGYEEFTKEHLDKIPVDLKDRALQNYSEEDLIWLMNNIAQNDNNYNLPIAQVGGENPFTVSGNPIVIPSEGMYPIDYAMNLKVNEAGIPYDEDGVLFSQSKIVSRFDANGKPLTRNQIAENQKIWNDQKLAYSSLQKTLGLWKNNPENTQQGYYNTKDFDDYLEEIKPKGKDVGLEGMQTGDCYNRGKTTGSCSTGQSNRGESLRDIRQYGGSNFLPKAQDGLSWMGNKLNNQGIITSETKGGNRVSFTGDQRVDDWINTQIDSGKFGFDPKTGGTFPLKKPVKGLSKEDQFKATRTYSSLVQGEGFNTDAQLAQIKKLPEWQQRIVNNANEKRRKDYVAGNMEEIMHHPLMSPGYFTPEGAVIGALQGAAKLGPDLYEGNYLGAAGDLLMTLPVTGPYISQGFTTAGRAFSKIKNPISKNNKKIIHYLDDVDEIENPFDIVDPNHPIFDFGDLEQLKNKHRNKFESLYGTTYDEKDLGAFSKLQEINDKRLKISDKNLDYPFQNELSSSFIKTHGIDAQLTPAEKLIVDFYQHGYDSNLNARPGFKNHLRNFYDPISENLESIITKTKTKKPEVFWRNQDDFQIPKAWDDKGVELQNIFFSDLKPGFTYEPQSFVSTSLNPLPTFGSIKTKINVPENQSFFFPNSQGYNMFYNELENILPSKLKFKIDDILEDGTIVKSIVNPYLNGGLIKAQEGKNIRVQNADGTISVMNTGSLEYREMYKSGMVQHPSAGQGDNPYFGGVLDEVSITRAPREKGFWEKYRDKIVEENKDAGFFGAIIGTPISAVMSLPQLAATYALTDEMQRPSEAWGFENNEGWFDSPSSFGKNLANFGLDAVTDPADWFGVGELTAAGRLTKAKALSKLKNIPTSVAPELRQGLHGNGIFFSPEYLEGVKRTATKKLFDSRSANIDENLKRLQLLTSPKTLKAIGNVDAPIADNMLYNFMTRKNYPSVKEFRTEVKKATLEANRIKKLNPEFDFSPNIFNDPDLVNHANDYLLSKPEYLSKFVNAKKAAEKTIANKQNVKSFLEKEYVKKMDLINQDPILKNIAEESPQYVDDIYDHLKNPNKSTDEFVNDLIKQSNTFTRSMHKSMKSGEIDDLDFFTPRGRSMGYSGKNTIDVEGFPTSDMRGEYGNNKYKIFPNEERMIDIASTPLEERWAKRFPDTFAGNENIDFGLGIHSNVVNDFLHKAIVQRRIRNNMLVSSGFAPIQPKVITSEIIPNKYLYQPKHVVFNTPEADQLVKGFDVEQVSDVWDKFKPEGPFGLHPGYTKGFKQGGVTKSKTGKQKMFGWMTS